MLTINRYLLREFAASVTATTIVLLFVAQGVLVADLLSLIAEGKVPVSLMFSQLGLRMLRWMPLVLPLGVFLGLMLAIGRLYRESEMAVLTSVGRSPRDMLKPLSIVALPSAVLVAVCSLWAGPWAQQTSSTMIADANRSLVIAGLEAGRFHDLPSGNGILYVTELSPDGSKMKNVFMQSEKKGRMSVITAKRGELFVDAGDRYLRLLDGMRVEGVPGQKNYRVLHYERSEVRLDPDNSDNGDDVSTLPTSVLLADPKPDARAELHWRIATPLAVLLLALLTIPLARSEPRQPRYGLLLLALALYVTYTALMLVGRAKLGMGKLPLSLGLWWLHAPMLLLGVWLLRRDGRIGKPRGASA
ncbi:MAG TPA: LPS export ABC transporter permease LptF [Xanthomonadaceae bacterium]|nr:LPS export ABC transporter permease LptF [Xanthomonadaceae bacterium]